MKVSKSAVFLFELMVIILVFTLAAAINTQIFASSFMMSQESRALTMGAINAQTMAEQFKSSGKEQEDQYFDKDWVPTTEAEAQFAVKFEDNGSTGAMKNVEIVVYQIDEQKEVFSLEVKRFEG